MKCSSKSPRFCSSECRHVAPDEPADGVNAEQHRRVEHALHERVLLRANRRIGVQHVVEIADVRQFEPRRGQRGLDAPRSDGIERPAQVERVRHRIEHRLRRHVGSRTDERPPTTESCPRPSSLANRIQSSMARSGSASRTSRGVSSCSAAVRMPIFMNVGSNARVGTAPIVLGGIPWRDADRAAVSLWRRRPSHDAGGWRAPHRAPASASGRRRTADSLEERRVGDREVETAE